MALDNSANSSPVRMRSSNFQFEVDYPKTKDLSIREFISFPTITAGGHDWELRYYPQGVNYEKQGSHISLYLVLRSAAKDVTAECSFELLAITGNFVTISKYIHTFPGFDSGWGCPNFIAKDKIENLYCVKDIIVISCNIRVIPEPRVVKNYPGGLNKHIEKLWEKGEGFDVTFEVEGESISAHRLILAARSPVFQAKLLGSMAESKMERIKINEMKAEVFKALLHFIYTDELAINGSNDDRTLLDEQLRDLFVAADRYALHKLILLCAEQLRKNLSVDTVVTTLHLADQHSCAELKRKCFAFAANPKNFSRVALTESYLHIMAGSPSLFVELSEKVKCYSHFAKKQRTG